MDMTLAPNRVQPSNPGLSMVPMCPRAGPVYPDRLAESGHVPARSHQDIINPLALSGSSGEQGGRGGVSLSGQKRAKERRGRDQTH